MDALADSQQVPAAFYALSYQQRDITRDISQYLLTLDYADYLSGQSDELNVILEDTEGNWADAWYPGHGDTLTLAIGWQGQAPRPVGRFEIDEIELALQPATVTIRALAAGINTAVRTTEHRAYEATTLDAVARQIATRQGLQLVGRIEPIKLDRLTQQESDLAFLGNLAGDYDYAFKVAGRRLVFHAIADLAAARPVARVTLEELSGVRLRDQIKQVPKAAEVKHKDPATKKLVTYRIVNGETVAVPSSSSKTTTSADTAKLRKRSASAEVAKARAKASLAKANRERTTGTWSMMGRPNLVSGNVIALDAAGMFGGHYLITASRHSFSRSGGYTSEQQVCRVSAPRIGLSLEPSQPDLALSTYGIQDNSNEVTA